MEPLLHKMDHSREGAHEYFWLCSPALRGRFASCRHVSLLSPSFGSEKSHLGYCKDFFPRISCARFCSVSHVQCRVHVFQCSVIVVKHETRSCFRISELGAIHYKYGEIEYQIIPMCLLEKCTRNLCEFDIELLVWNSACTCEISGYYNDFLLEGIRILHTNDVKCHKSESNEENLGGRMLLPHSYKDADAEPLSSALFFLFGISTILSVYCLHKASQ